ncbi:MAG TPA: matrixin family metalloprotease [Patescibacteria group bacterium]|jgi:hypothetical protein
MKAERIGAAVATVWSVFAMGGEPAQQPPSPEREAAPLTASDWQLSDLPPGAVDPPEVEFRGDVRPDLIAAYREAEEAAEIFWERVGAPEPGCDGETVVFTDHFEDQQDFDPDTEPAGAFSTKTCQKWLNSRLTPEEMQRTNTHEEGHNRGLGHSSDPDSIMYDSRHHEDGDLVDPPDNATVERFEEMFDVGFEDR